MIHSDFKVVSERMGFVNVAEDGRRAAELMLADARQKAQEIMKHASWDASEIIAAAKEEADRTVEESRCKGYQDGLEQGRTEGKKEYEQSCLAAAETVISLEAERNHVIEGMEEEFVNLVLDTAGKVLKAELDRNDDAFANMVNHALCGVRAPENLTLRIHPSRYPGISALAESPPSGKEWISDMNIIQDEDMDPMDCRIETGCGTMDTGISTQLEQIGKAFRRLLE
jgi:flagellar assembly protein FliH